MNSEPDPLTLPVARGARIVALDRLEAADAPAGRLTSKPDDLDALHDFRVALRRVRSWIRAFKPELEGSIGGKDRQRLRDLKNATNRGRDADVQIEWLEKASKHGNGNRKRGAERLIDQIKTEQRNAGAPLDGDSLQAFSKERARLAKHLSTITEPVRPPRSPPPTLAAVIGNRLATHVQTLRDALRAVRTADDEAEAHAARIAAKRLRYLIEAADDVRGAKSLIAQLKTLQDELGALHDAHVLGHRVRVALVDFAGPDQDGVRAINERLAADRLAIYRRIQRRWLADDAAFAAFSHRVGLLADRLTHRTAEQDSG